MMKPATYDLPHVTTRCRKTGLTLLMLPLMASVSLPVSALEPAPIRAGNFDIIPTISLSSTWNDNVVLTSDEPVDSIVWLVAPSVTAMLQNNDNVYSLTASTVSGRYNDSPADDYDDWFIDASADLQLTSRNALSLQAGYSDEHEFRGRGFAEGGLLPPEPNRFNTSSLGMNYLFGADGARSRLQFRLNYREIDFKNTLNISNPRDNETYDAAATYFYSSRAQTDLLLEYQYRDISFLSPDSSILGSRDNQQEYIYLGVQREQGARLTGSVRVGFGQIHFDAPDRSDNDMFSWQADLSYALRTYSTLTLAASRNYREALNFGSSSEASSYSFTWAHNWSDRLASNFNLSHNRNDFQDFDRLDRTNSASLNFTYGMRRWLDLNLTLSREDRSSVEDRFNFEQNLITIGIQASL